MTEIPDCLVLKIEEHDIYTMKLDTTLYILYDKKENKFIVRGKRFSKKIDSCTYSFTCNFAEELADFISFVICVKNKWSYILYNYDNLPYTSNEITYKFLKNHDSKSYELSAYEDKEFNRDELLKNVRILKNVFNYYN